MVSAQVFQPGATQQYVGKLWTLQSVRVLYSSEYCVGNWSIRAATGIGEYMRFGKASFVMCLVLSLQAVGAPASMATPGGWRQWRGPNRDGKSADTGLLKSWPKGGPKKLWEIKGIGNGYSSVTIDGGLTYITGRKPHVDEKIEYENPPKHIWQIKGQGFYVTAIDHATGEVKLSKDVATAYYDQPLPDGSAWIKDGETTIMEGREVMHHPLRGGGLRSTDRRVRTASRYHYPATIGCYYTGFRVVVADPGRPGI